MTNSKKDQIKQLEEKIDSLSQREDWCRNQMEGLDRQSSGCGRNDDYWDTRDLIKERRSEAMDLEREIKMMEQQLADLKRR
jgi:chromosome segregation ATPase